MKTLQTARLEAARKLGLTLAPDSRGGELAQADFFRLQTAMADLILQEPAAYPANLHTWARQVKAAPGYSPPLTLAEKAGIFADEFTAQAAELNPVPSLARNLRWLLPVAALLALVFYFAPRIGAGVAAAKGSSR